MTKNTTTAKKSAFWTEELTAQVVAAYKKGKAEGIGNKELKEQIGAEIGATARQVQGKLVAEGAYMVEDATPAAKSGGVQKVHLIRDLSAELGISADAVGTLDKANFADLSTLLASVKDVKQAAFEMGANAAEGDLLDSEEVAE